MSLKLGDAIFTFQLEAASSLSRVRPIRYERFNAQWTSSGVRCVWNRGKWRKSVIQLPLTSISKPLLASFSRVYTTKDIPDLMNFVINLELPPLNTDSLEYLMRSTTQAINYWTELIDIKFSSVEAKKITEDATVQEAFAKYTTWSSIIRKQEEIIGSLTNGAMHWGQLIFIFDASQPKPLIINNSIALMMFEMSRGRLILQVARCLHSVQHIDITYEYFNRVQNILFSLIREIGNLAFDIIKSLDSCVKAVLCMKFHPSLVHDFNLSEIRRKLLNKLNGEPSSWHHLDNLFDLLFDVPLIEVLGELSGVSKLFGFPTVDLYKSAAALKEVTQDEIRFLPQDLVNLQASFCKHSLISYVTQSGMWPPFKIPPRQGTCLYKLWVQRSPILHKNDFPVSDCCGCVIGPLYRDPIQVSALDLIEDKAISPPTHLLHKRWSSPREIDSETKLILQVLENPPLIKECINRTANEVSKYHGSTILLRVKEMEQKQEIGRLFSMLPIHARIAFSYAEKTLAETYMSDLLHEQTMTMSKNELLKSISEVTKTGQASKYKLLFIEVDFSKWNSRWRREPVNAIANRLEHLYDYPISFSLAHNWFQNSTVILAHPDLLPTAEVLERTSWTGHKGGFEGIQQKLWTIVTESMLHLALEDVTHTYTIKGQGDNQVVTFKIPSSLTDQEQLRFVKETMDKVQAVSRKYNQEVKPEESFTSSSLFSYSKDLYWNGIDISPTLKHTLKWKPALDSDIPSMITIVDSIVGSCSLGGSRLTHPLKFVHLAYVIIYTELIREHLVPLVGGVSAELISKLTTDEKFTALFFTIPASLGGFPMPSITRSWFRGKSDDVSYDVAGLLLLARVHPMWSTLIHYIRTQQMRSNIPEDLLVLDPSALPVEKPKHPKSVLTLLGRNLVESLYPAEEYSAVFESGRDPVRTVFVKTLMSMNPLYPHIAAALYQWSPFGVFNTIANKFNKSSTITTRLPRSDVVRELTRSTNSLTYSVGSLISRVLSGSCTIDYTSYGAYNLTSLLRDSWKEAGYSGIEGCSVYTPFETRPVSGVRNVGIIISSSSTPSQVFVTRGPCEPYLGMKTIQKREESALLLQGGGPASRSVKGILLTAKLLNFHPSKNALIKSLLESWTSLNCDLLYDLTPTPIGGAIAHRWDDMQYRPLSVPSNPLSASHFTLSTDSMPDSYDNLLDYPLVFQEWFLCAISLMVTMYLSTPTPILRSITLPVPPMSALVDEPVSIALDECISFPTVPPRITPPLEISSVIVVDDLVWSDTAIIEEEITDSFTLAMLIWASTLTTMNETKATYLVREGLYVPIQQLDVREFIGLGWQTIIESAAIFCAAYVSPDLLSRNKFNTDISWILPLRSAAAILEKRLSKLYSYSSVILSFLEMSGLPRIPPGSTGHHVISAKVRSMIVEKALQFVNNPSTIPMIHTHFTVGSPSLIVRLFQIYLRVSRLIISVKVKKPISPSSFLYPNKASNMFELPVPDLVKLILEVGSDMHSLEQEHFSEHLNICHWFDTIYRSRYSLRNNVRRLRYKPQKTLYHTITSSIPFCVPDLVHLVQNKNPASCSLVVDTHVSHILSSLTKLSFVGSTLSSRWATYLRDVDIPTVTGVVGVGGGGVVAALHTYSSTTVIGIDLLSYFPTTGSSFINYIPPGALDPDRFSWHDSVLQLGGDVLENPQILSQIAEDVGFVIVDLPLNIISDTRVLQELLQLIARNTVLIRLVGQSERVDKLIKLLPEPGKVRSISSSSSFLDIACLYNKFVFWREWSIDVESAVNTNITRYDLNVDPAGFLTAYNTAIRLSGLSLTELTMDACRDMKKSAETLMRVLLRGKKHSVCSCVWNVMTCIINRDCDDLLELAESENDLERKWAPPLFVLINGSSYLSFLIGI